MRRFIDQLNDYLMRKDELMRNGMSESDALAKIAEEKKTSSAKIAEEVAAGVNAFDREDGTSQPQPTNTRNGSLNGYRAGVNFPRPTMASTFGGPAWGELLKRIRGGEQVPDRAAAAAMMGGEGEANITKFGMSAIQALGQGEKGYKTFQTTYDRLKTLGAHSLAAEYQKAAANAGVLNNEYGSNYSTRLDQAQAGAINNPTALMDVLTDYQTGQMGKKGVQSIVQTSGVKGMNGVLQEIDRRNSAIQHTSPDEREGMTKQLQEYMATAAGKASFGDKKQLVDADHLEEMGKAAARVTEHLGKFTGGLKDATELVGKNQTPKGVGKLKPDLDMVSQLVKAADRGDSTAQGMLTKYGEQPLREVAGKNSELDDKMKRAMLEGKGEFNPDGPLSKRMGNFINDMTSGFELFRLQRVWGMTGGEAFKKFIPAAAGDALTLAGASRVIGGDRVGPISGMAGEMLQGEAARKDININAGKRAYQAWGGFVNANAGWISDVQAVDGPALGAGAMVGLTGMKLASLLGAGAMATPLGLLAGAGVAGAGLFMANRNIREAESKITPDNQLTNARNMAASGIDLGAMRQQLAEKQKEPEVAWWTYLLSDFGYMAQSEQKSQRAAEVGKMKNAVSGAEKIAGVSLGNLPGEYIQPTVELMAKDSANKGMFIGYDQEAMKKKISAVAPYDSDMMNFRPVSTDQFQATSFMKRLESSALGFEGALNLAQQTAAKYNLGPQSVEGVANNQPTSMKDILGYMYKTDMFAPAQRWGINPLAASKLPLLEGRDAIRAQDLMSGDRTAWTKTGTDLWNQGVRDLGNGDQIQDVFTMEPGTMAPIGTTDTSKRSRKAIAGARATMGLRDGEFGINADMSNLDSIASLETTKRDLEYGYQMKQFSFQNQALQSQRDYAMGRPAVYNGSQMDSGLVGSFGWQERSQSESVRHTQAQATIAAGTMNFGYLGQGLSQQVTGASLSELGQSGVSYRQFYENLDLNRRQSKIGRDYSAEDAQISHDRGTMQIGWQQSDLSTNFGRQMTDFTHQLQDLTTNISRNRTQTGWQQEQIAFQGAQTSINYGWGMEDVDESLRYATGRDRRRLLKQKERSTISYAMNMGQLDTESGHVTEKLTWTEEDFAKDKGRIEERRAWASADFEKEKGRLDQRDAWLDEDLARALVRLGTQNTLEDESYALRVKQFEEDMAMSKTSHDEGLANAKAIADIQTGSAAEAKSQFEDNWSRNKEEANAAQTQYGLMRDTVGQLSAATAVASIQANVFAYDFGDKDGAMAKSFNLFTKGFEAMFEGVNKSTDDAGRRLRAMLDSLGTSGAQTIPYKETWGADPNG